MILDGKALASQKLEELKRTVEQGIAEGRRRPHLAVIMAGYSPASAAYVARKRKACEGAGVLCSLHHVEDGASGAHLEALVRRLNADDDVDGILVQLPLPEGLCSRNIIEAIDPEKDVDGLTAKNAGLAAQLGMAAPFLPCTVLGIAQLIRHYGIATRGRRAVVVGRGELVGRPLAQLLASKDFDATVTLCHSRTEDLASITREADILVSAAGHCGLITAGMVREGAAIIDAGTALNAEGKLRGDVDFAAVQGIAGHITPVPGGVGPMTVAMVVANTCAAWLRRTAIAGPSVAQKCERF